MSDPYADIRPYRDDEVAPVLRRLLGDREFLDAIAALRLGKLAGIAPGLVRPLVRFRLAREVRGVDNIGAMQDRIKQYMDRMIEGTTRGFSVSGLERLDPQRAHLFISNHRDIAMDPAFTNYALHQSGRETVRIAIGDNLLTKPWASDLMRLNKSFIVRRAVSGPRELLAASKTLSSYIRFSLQQENAPVWLAQREGRAKDGVDRTEPAVIKMLSLSRDKREQGFGGTDGDGHRGRACEALKANELHQLATTGSYEKGEQEDIASIGQGIAGEKGRVHVSFGEPLGAEFDTAEEVAAEIDRQVIDLYCLHPTNLQAYRMLFGEDARVPDDLYLEEGDCSPERFAARIDALPESHRPYALGIYANAVASKLKFAQAPGPC